MNHSPGQISTEPLLAAMGGRFSPPAAEIATIAAPNHPRQTPVHTSNQPFVKSRENVQPAELQVAAVPPSPSVLPSVKDAAALGHDLPAQIEQLRNDIFGIAMNVSALNDRMDRLEQRLPPAGQSAQAGIAALRGEIENWLENHLHAAVEHCMHQIISRTNSIVSNPLN